MTSHNRRAALVGERLAIIRRMAEERGAGGVLLQERANFAWATAGGESHVVLSSSTGVAGLLVTPNGATVLTAVNEADRIADEELSGLGIEVQGLPWHDDGAMHAAATRIAGSTPLGDVELEDAIMPARCRLSELDVERLAVLGQRATAAAHRALAQVRPGSTEHEIAAAALEVLAGDGIRAPVLLAAADDRIARYRHPLPTDRRVQARLMLVVVAERWGLHAAVTRFAELEPLDDEVERRMEATGRVHAAMTAATRPGRTLGDVMAAAQAAYAEAGHPDEWQLHHQGGIIGYQGRERIAVPGDETVIESAMAFAWNPSIAGAKAEETAVLVGDELRTLTV